MQGLDEMNDELKSTKKELDEMTRSMLQMEEDRDMWRKLFEDCNKKQGQEIERLRQEYKERSEQMALTTAMEKVIPARDIPRGQSPMELLTPREMSQTTETRPPVETNRVTIPDPSDTLGDPVVEQSVRKLIETAGRLVANKNAPGSGVTAPYGTIDDTGRVQLSQTVIRQGISNVTPLMGSSRIPERKVRKMPAKKVSRIIDVQKNNQLKYNFTGVPETDPRACFNRATWSPAVNLQQPPLGTSHLILGDSLVRVLSNLTTSWVTTVMAFGGATIAQLYRMVELMNPERIPNVMILVGTNDISRGSDEQEALWESMMVCLFTTLWHKFSCAVRSRGFLSRLRDPTTAENAVWPAIKDILESMGEVVDATKEGSFSKVALRVVFALSTGYAHLPDGLKFVYAIVALLSEGKYDVIISAPNRLIEMENLRPLKSELPAVWSDISNAMRGFKDHALHMLVLDEVLGLELSNFSRQLKLKPGIDDDHRVIAAMSNDLWFRAMEVAGEDTRRKNSLETRAHLEAMILRTKPEANQWLHLNPRVAALGADAFQQGPVIITKIHAYLLKEVNLAENAGEKTAEFVNRMCQITLETFWTQEMKGQEGFERTDSMLEGLGAGWTASFLAKVYPKVSHYLIKEFLQAVVRVSIVELFVLFVTFGAESFVKGPAMLLTDGIQNLRLDGLLTLIAITHGNLGGLMERARCPEQMKERVRNLDMKKSTDSWNKIRDLRHTLIQYLLQQNRFGTGEDETTEREEDVRRHVGGMPLLTDLSLAMRTDPLALIRGVTEFVTVIYGPAVTFAFPDVKVEAYRRSVLHLNLISAVDGSTLNWCEQHTLRELMSEDVLCAKISEPEMTVINFDDHFRDRMGEVERGHIEVFPRLWNLRPYDKTNGEITRVPRLTAAYHKVREETKDWGDYKKLPEAIPEFPLIRRMLLGAVSVVQTPRLGAFEANERGVGNFVGTMDPYFVGRNAAVLQYTRFAYTDQATRRRISNAATPKPGRFDEEWKN